MGDPGGEFPHRCQPGVLLDALLELFHPLALGDIAGDVQNGLAIVVLDHLAVDLDGEVGAIPPRVLGLEEERASALQVLRAFGHQGGLRQRLDVGQAHLKQLVSVVAEALHRDLVDLQDLAQCVVDKDRVAGAAEQGSVTVLRFPKVLVDTAQVLERALQAAGREP